MHGLTIDYGEDRLYWANMQYIESSDLEGKCMVLLQMY